MFTNRTNKLIAAVCFIVIVVFSFFLLGNLINMKITEVKDGLIALSFIYILVIIIALIVFYAMFFNVINKSILNINKLEAIIDAKNNEIESYLKKNKKKEEKSDGKKEVDIEKNAEKLIPSLKPEETTLEKYTEAILLNIAKEIEIVVGVFYIYYPKEDKYRISGQYAFVPEGAPDKINFGEGLSGQVAKNKEQLHLSDVPEEYLDVYSGLGKSKPKHLLITPVVYRKKAIGIIELGAFKHFEDYQLTIIDKMCNNIADTINKIMNRDNK